MIVARCESWWSGVGEEAAIEPFVCAIADEKGRKCRLTATVARHRRGTGLLKLLINVKEKLAVWPLSTRVNAGARASAHLGMDLIATAQAPLM